jgi:hypothetical protein
VVSVVVRGVAAVLCALLLMGAAPAKVDLFGYYFLEAPKGFPEIDHLHLSTIDVRKGEMVEVPLHGWIRGKAKGKALPEDFPLVNPVRSGRDFSFTTKAMGGVSYRFKGRFLKLGNFPEERPEAEVVLRGRLARVQDGKVKVESEIGFSYTGGD